MGDMRLLVLALCACLAAAGTSSRALYEKMGPRDKVVSAQMRERGCNFSVLRIRLLQPMA
jgi:hypothetical protein